MTMRMGLVTAIAACWRRSPHTSGSQQYHVQFINNLRLYYCCRCYGLLKAAIGCGAMSMVRRAAGEAGTIHKACEFIWLESACRQRAEWGTPHSTRRRLAYPTKSPKTKLRCPYPSSAVPAHFEQRRLAATRRCMLRPAATACCWPCSTPQAAAGAATALLQLWRPSKPTVPSLLLTGLPIDPAGHVVALLPAAVRCADAAMRPLPPARHAAWPLLAPHAASGLQRLPGQALTSLAPAAIAHKVLHLASQRS